MQIHHQSHVRLLLADVNIENLHMEECFKSKINFVIIVNIGDTPEDSFSGL